MEGYPLRKRKSGGNERALQLEVRSRPGEGNCNPGRMSKSELVDGVKGQLIWHGRTAEQPPVWHFCVCVR